MKTTCGRAIAVFAHNESNNIIACLKSVKEAMGRDDRCVVLNNGSTDNTQILVDQFCKENLFSSQVTIELGDKSNAWNLFVHECNIDAEIYIFLDGDCRISRQSFNALESCIRSQPEINAAAGIPDIGISPKNHKAMIKDGGLSGNLYALPSSFVNKIRNHEIRLPVGLIGDDSLVGALAAWDLNPKNQWNRSRIHICVEANFLYDRISLLDRKDRALYYRRRIRYSLRHFQIKLMRDILKKEGVKGMPATVDELYAKYQDKLRLEWRGLDTWFDYLALKRINRAIGK